jgi:hypothetical protein
MPWLRSMTAGLSSLMTMVGGFVEAAPFFVTDPEGLDSACSMVGVGGKRRRVSLLGSSGAVRRFGFELTEQFHGLVGGKDAARLDKRRHLSVEHMSLGEDHASILTSNSNLKPSVDQRTRLNDGDVEALLGVPVAKPEMGHRADTVESQEETRDEVKRAKERPHAESHQRGGHKGLLLRVTPRIRRLAC